MVFLTKGSAKTTLTRHASLYFTLYFCVCVKSYTRKAKFFITTRPPSGCILHEIEEGGCYMDENEISHRDMAKGKQ